MIKTTVLDLLDHDEWLAARALDITSSDVAALFGVSPYLTKYDLWWRKSQRLIPPFEMTDRVKWGTRMEEPIADGVAEDQGWTVRPMKEYRRNAALRIGSSFDYCILDEHGHDGAILEIKAVDWLQHKNKWLQYDDGTVEAPLHIELQLQHQLLLAGLSKGYIAAMIGGNQVQLLEREAIPDYQQTILDKCAEFWASVDANQPPAPDFPDDLDVIKRLNGFGDPNKFRDATGDASIRLMCEAYDDAREQEKAATAAKDTAKAQMLMAIGEHSKVTCGLWTISAGMVGEAEISYHRAGYRNFKLSKRKG